MYNGYDISPRNLQTRVVTLSVVFPEAPRQTNKGNATAKHIVSYIDAHCRQFWESPIKRQ